LSFGQRRREAGGAERGGRKRAGSGISRFVSLFLLADDPFPLFLSPVTAKKIQTILYALKTSLERNEMHLKI